MKAVTVLLLAGLAMASASALPKTAKTSLFKSITETVQRLETSASALPKTAKTSLVKSITETVQRLESLVHSHTLSHKQTVKAKAIGCDICTMVVTELDKLIIDGEDSIVDAVEGLCTTVDGLFPGGGATCKTLVDSYLPQLIELLVDKQLSPPSVCALLTLCPLAELP